MSTEPIIPVSYRDRICVAATHPCLPGHFPDRPLVPGVLLLERVAAALRRWRSLEIAQLVQAKFLQPLLPGQSAELLLEPRGTRIAFSIHHEAQLIASGLLETRSDVAESMPPPLAGAI